MARCLFILSYRQTHQGNVIRYRVLQSATERSVAQLNPLMDLPLLFMRRAAQTKGSRLLRYLGTSKRAPAIQPQRSTKHNFSIGYVQTTYRLGVALPTRYWRGATSKAQTFRTQPNLQHQPLAECELNLRAETFVNLFFRPMGTTQ
ncbi:hypothetical protein BDR03DRAFT_504763 [Suillus americanus]|nr:hypothetical protein BDR03DRAFT_504763 [Suillus americanus]